MCLRNASIDSRQYVGIISFFQAFLFDEEESDLFA